MRPRRRTEYRSLIMTLDLDESEQFEIGVQRQHRARRPVHVSQIFLSWNRMEQEGEVEHGRSWALIGNNVKEDGTLGASVRVPLGYVDPPQIVARALTDLAPEWSQ